MLGERNPVGDVDISVGLDGLLEPEVGVGEGDEDEDSSDEDVGDKTEGPNNALERIDYCGDFWFLQRKWANLNIGNICNLDNLDYNLITNEKKLFCLYF